MTRWFHEVLVTGRHPSTETLGIDFHRLLALTLLLVQVIRGDPLC